MALLDKISKWMAYFDSEDVVEEPLDEFPGYEAPIEKTPEVTTQASPQTRTERQKTMANQMASNQTPYRETERTPRLQQVSADKTIIDIKFPKKYEDAREIVSLLLQDASVLIDFQHMTDSQARRCIDYLDGARFVLEGNLKKISSTMWLLTPVNVVVNIEDVGLRQESSDAQFDFDMKRR